MQCHLPSPPSDEFAAFPREVATSRSPGIPPGPSELGGSAGRLPPRGGRLLRGRCGCRRQSREQLVKAGAVFRLLCKMEPDLANLGSGRGLARALVQLRQRIEECQVAREE